MSASYTPSRSKVPSKSVEKHLEDLLEEKKQMVEDAEEEKRTEHTSYSNTGVWQGMKWTFVFAILLWWFPIYGQMIAGYIGGRKAGSASKALISSSVPAAIILGLAYSIDMGYLPIPKEWLVEGPKYVSERISEILPVGIPYIDVLVTSFSSVLTAQMNYFAIIILFSLIGGVLADEGTKTTVVKGYKITGQYSFFDDAPHRVDSAIDTLVDKVADVIGVHDENVKGFASRPKKGWSSEHLVTPEISDDELEIENKENERLKVVSKEGLVKEGLVEEITDNNDINEDKKEKNKIYQRSKVVEKKVPDILARPKKSTLEKLGVYEYKELPVAEKRRRLVEEQAWSPKRLESKKIDETWTKKEKVTWSPKKVEKNSIWPKLRKKDLRGYTLSRNNEEGYEIYKGNEKENEKEEFANVEENGESMIDKLDKINLQKIGIDDKHRKSKDDKNEKNIEEIDNERYKEKDSIIIGGKEIKDIKKEELIHKYKVAKLPKYLQPEEEQLWDADLKIVDSHEEVPEQKQHILQDIKTSSNQPKHEKTDSEKTKREIPKPEPLDDIILLDSGELDMSKYTNAEHKQKDKGSEKKENKPEESNLQLRFDDEEPESTDWDKL